MYIRVVMTQFKEFDLESMFGGGKKISLGQCPCMLSFMSVSCIKCFVCVCCM